MKVFKFGGGVLNHPETIDILYSILEKYHEEKIIVVVSAFGKTTNAIEQLIEKAKKDENFNPDYLKIKQYYHKFIEVLFGTDSQEINDKIDLFFEEFRRKVENLKSEPYDVYYDQTVSFGELWSSIIVSEYLKYKGLANKWLDVRKMLITNTFFRGANVLDIPSVDNIRMGVTLDLDSKLFITQGFIGSTDDGRTTTLGREGSDYTAAYFASALDVEQVTFWKDVDGIYNADPHKFNNCVLIPEMNFEEAAELTKMGAKILHPKTIKPLMEHNIPFEVKGFAKDFKPGTKIFEKGKIDDDLPILVYKTNQILITIVSQNANNFDVMQRKALSRSFYPFEDIVAFQKLNNEKLMVCMNYRKEKVEQLVTQLKKDFSVFYSKNLDLFVIKNFNNSLVESISSKRVVFQIEKMANKEYILVESK